jgi:hypothetical protein
LIWRMLDWFLNTTASSEIASVECGFDIGTNETSFFRGIWLLQIFFLFEVEMLLVLIVLSGFSTSVSVVLILALFALIEIYITGSVIAQIIIFVCVCANILWNILCFRDSCEIVNISKWRVARRIRHADNFSLLCERATNKFRGLKKLIFDIIFCSEAIELTSLAANLM